MLFLAGIHNDKEKLFFNWAWGICVVVVMEESNDNLTRFVLIIKDKVSVIESYPPWNVSPFTELVAVWR